MTYKRACAEHEWNVPERYNIAADVCDKHPREKAAMVWERFDGATRELNWGELQDLSNQAAHMLREHGIGKGDRVAVVLPPTPETAAIFFGTWKLGAILLSMSVLYGDEGIRHRLTDSAPEAADHRRRERRPLRRVAGGRAVGARRGRRPARRPSPPTTSARTPLPTTRRSSTTTRRARRARRRASSTPIATSSPTRSSSTATTSVTARPSTAWANGRGPPASPPCSARGAWAPSSTCCNARLDSSLPISSTSSRAIESRTCSRRRRRCAR